MWIQTYTGKKFSLTDPQPEDVCIDDIVAALSRIVRFGGHCRGQYTVLQHSVHVSEIVPECHKYTALLHDAGEAYYGDITRPQKQVFRAMTTRGTRCGPVCEFDAFGSQIDAAIAEALGVPYPVPEAVKHADNVMLATEARDLMVEPPEPWDCLPPPLEKTLEVWTPQRTHWRFVDAYHAHKPVKPKAVP